MKEVRARWPSDAAEVSVGGQTRWILAADRDAMAAEPPAIARLLGPYDLFLQARDRPLVVDDPARAKALWPALGRPGAVLVNGDLAGIWRPRKSGGKLRLQIEPWTAIRPPARTAIEEQAERLAAYRRVSLSGVDLAAG